MNIFKLKKNFLNFKLLPTYYSAPLIASAILIINLLFSTTNYVFANDEVNNLSKNPNFWANPGGNYENSRYSKLRQINNKNVHQLSTSWTFSYGSGIAGQEGAPLILPSDATGLSDSHMYIYSSSFGNINVRAINLATLEVYWRYEHQEIETDTTSNKHSDIDSRGLSFGEGMIFFLTDTELVALNANTGNKEWETEFNGITNTTTPYVVKDKILIGILSTHSESRSLVQAYNINDGSLAWQAYATGPDEDILFNAKTTSLGKRVGKNSSIRTWKKHPWKFSGGSSSGWFSADLDNNLVYYGSGNIQTWEPSFKPGDNKWSMSIFARDISTGYARWVFQMTPHNEWDYDDVNGLTLADIKVDNKLRKVLVNFDNKGFGFTIDRVSGELLVADKYDSSVKWATSIDMKTGFASIAKPYPTYDGSIKPNNICSAALGIKDRQPSTYNPRANLFYVPTNNACISNYSEIIRDTTKAEENISNLIAWDASTGKIIWSIPESSSIWSGTLTTSGDVMFYGTLDGLIKAIDAKSGKLLWKHKMPSGVAGNINTWSHQNKQYVGVLSGIGEWAKNIVNPNLISDSTTNTSVTSGGYRRLLNSNRNSGVFTAFSLSNQDTGHIKESTIPTAGATLPGVAFLTPGTGGLLPEARGVDTIKEQTVQQLVTQNLSRTNNGSTSQENPTLEAQAKSIDADDRVAYWNNWIQEPTTNGETKKVDSLIKSKNISYEYVLDISPYNYLELIGGGVKTSIPDSKFQERISELIDAGIEEVRFKIRPIIIGDNIAIPDLENSSHIFKINLNRLKKDYRSQNNLIEQLKNKKITLEEFSSVVQAGEIRLSITAKEVGCAAIAFSVWDEEGLIPYDHLVTAISVSERGKPLTDCGENNGNFKAGFNTLLSRLIDFNKHPSPKADISLNIFETKINGQNKSTAIFVDNRYQSSDSNKKNDSGQRILTWEMRSLLSQYISATLPDAVDNAKTVASDGKEAYPYAKVAKTLKKKLFTSRDRENKNAEIALKQLKSLSKEKTHASVLVRFISHDNQRLYLPLNLLSAKAKKTILENPITVVQHLPRERYMSDTGKKHCIDPWTFGIPDELQGITDMMGIENFVQQPKVTWWERKNNVGDLIEHINIIRKEKDVGEGLLLLAHHNKGVLWYESKHNIFIPEDISRAFNPGSVAILAACSAAGITSESRKILEDLNVYNEIDTIILSPFQVRGSYGSRFAYDFANTIINARNENRAKSITELFWEASKNTSNYFINQDKEAYKYMNEMALEFVILGDHNLRLCTN